MSQIMCKVYVHCVVQGALRKCKLYVHCVVQGGPRNSKSEITEQWMYKSTINVHSVVQGAPIKTESPRHPLKLWKIFFSN